MKKLSEMMNPLPLNSGFKMEGYWVWDGSVVKGEDGNYHMYASRWPKTVPMHPGWLVRSEIVHAVSSTPYGPFTFSEVALPPRGPEYWDGCVTHNPHIKKIGDMYVLYYTGTRYILDCPDEEVSLDHPSVIYARAQKRVGVAYSKSVYGPWERSDHPLLETRPGCADSYLTSNPVACVDKTGDIFMIYKGRAYTEPDKNPYRYGSMKLLFAKGKDAFSLERPNDNVVLGHIQDEMEDPFVWYDRGYHVMAKDMSGAICGEKRAGFHAFSDNGREWTIDKEPFYSRKIMYEDGKECVMGNLERPFILFEEEKPICAYFAVSDGTDKEGFMGCKNTWTIAIPLKI